MLRKAESTLQSSYGSVQREKSELQSSLKNVTAERDLLKANVDNLTAEQEELLGRIDKLNATLQGNTEEILRKVFTELRNVFNFVVCNTEKHCPAGWRKFQYSCYFPSTTKKTWTLSREDCHSKGADLAIVTINLKFLLKNVWIGLTDGGVEGQWKWVDGTPLTLTFWAQGQPNSHQGRNQDCVEVWLRTKGDGDWNDENCSVEQHWICEK
uniref:C-type lectin domain-containing protein n=1 Tax=Xiphophorus couchianus TaxID=32473 RepID=A0A3B5LIR9_9TELE